MRAILTAVPTCAQTQHLLRTACATGLDHFFARVAPAKRYDQLDPEFNRGMLVGSITLAFVGTYLLSILAAQKTLAEQWK